jgi:hypothetical protein
MAFKFELGDPGDIAIGPDGDWVAEFSIGFDLELDEIINMAVALIENQPEPNPFTLTFGIVRRAANGGDQIGEVIFDHSAARAYVARERANQVMIQILNCIEQLCALVDPSEVQFSTFEADLPPPAMQKYFKVSNHLGICGYEMNFYRREGADLRDNWFFTKRVRTEVEI